MADIARIEDRIDRVAASTLEVSDALGGLRFQNMVEVMEFAKCMAIADTAVPKHLRGNVGMCLAVCVQALEWRFSPFAVANKSYVVNDRIGYESQLVHAVIEQRAPIVGRLRHTFTGEGEDRRCIVSAQLRETGETLEYISPPFSKIQPKNSPLWKTKPDLQLYYNTSRDFCRAYFPDVLLGVYSQEELRDHVGPDNAKEVGNRPSVGDRLKGNKGRGFNASHVERETRGGVIDETNKSQAKEPEANVDLPAAGAAAGSSRHDAGRTASTTSEGMDVTAGETAPDSNSSRAHISPDVETDKPATEESPLPAVAGDQSELSAAPPEPGNVEARTGDLGGETGPQPTLPQGWEIRLRDALSRARKPDSLIKYARQCFEMLGAFPASDAEKATAKAIRQAFETHFGNPDAINEELRELI